MADRIDGRPEFRPLFLEGIEHFNSGEFWEAHESWEELWLEAESEVHQFLQGLIQLAAAYHHVKRGTFSGAARLFVAALRRLEPFPSGYCGIDREQLVDSAKKHEDWVSRLLERATDRAVIPDRLKGEDFPRIILHEGWSTSLPPSDPW